MSLILATGSNIGNKKENLNLALNELKKHLSLIKASSIFKSSAVDYENQPDFYNQVLEFELPKNITPLGCLDLVLNIEKSLGRTRGIDKGPRTVDIDIIFWGMHNIIKENLKVPHPRWNKRSFVVSPLQQLPFFQTIQKHYIIPLQFDVEAEEVN